MPINKDALVRYRIINKCLINKFKTYPTKEELKDACIEALGVDSISDRTIEKDIEDMRYNVELGYLAPIEYNKKFKGYRYTDINYSIDKIPLKADDLNALQFATSILSQFSHLSILKDFTGAVTKIMEAVNINRMVLENSDLDFIEFGKAEYVAGGPFLENLVLAIKDSLQVSFTYKKHGNSESKNYTLDPYLLKEYKNVWYVIGKDPSTSSIKTFGLDRIVNLEILKSTFEQSADFDKKKYFENAFGITSSYIEPEEVILKFSKKTGDYIKASPLHKSQRIVKEDPNECEVSLTVYPTIDLVMQLLSYGSDVEVIAPASLRNQIKLQLQSTLEKYLFNK